MPEARFGHAAASIASLIYVTGGRSSYSGMHSLQSQLWAYNVQTDSWSTELPELPEPRTDHAMIALGDTLWIFGGRSGNAIIGSVLYWVEGSDQWQYAAEFPVPREGMRSFVHNGLVYLIGGKTSHSMWAQPAARVDRFDPLTLSWSVMDSLNQARVDFAAAAHGDTVVCIGGRFIDPIASIENGILGGSWQTVTPLLVPRSNSSAVYYQNQIVLIGGFTSNGQADNNLAFDGNNWIDFDGNLLPRYDAAVLSASSGIFILGGRNGNQALTSLEYYSSTVGVGEPPIVPGKMALIKSYPNPFNGATVIKVNTPGLDVSSNSLIIYGLNGEAVHRQQLPAQRESHTVSISGSQLGPSGIYVAVFNYVLLNGQAGQVNQKLTLLK
ncbi:MAG: hypothetical protein L3J79_09840 [Candidatus Marinimicrobia bacterium]|nr:hypothetical protein [Candidatus Neomarinimicrobiota bacterium]